MFHLATTHPWVSLSASMAAIFLLCIGWLGLALMEVSPMALFSALVARPAYLTYTRTSGRGEYLGVHRPSDSAYQVAEFVDENEELAAVVDRA